MASPASQKAVGFSRVHGADQREAAVTSKLHAVRFSFGERFCVFLLLDFASRGGSRSEPSNKLGSWCCPVAIAAWPCVSPLAPLPFALALSSWARCQMGSLVLGGALLSQRRPRLDQGAERSQPHIDGCAPLRARQLLQFSRPLNPASFLSHLHFP